MTATTKTGGLRKALAGVCALALALCLAVPALAISIPQRPENQYVLDEAGVLSEETEQEIIDTNNALFEETGAQVVVVAVDFLGGEDIEDYAYTLFNSWGIGSVERNNGLLLLLAIGEDNYYAMSGYGLEDYFDGAKLKEMLNDYLEEDFAARDYDAGVEKFFSQAVSQVKTYYANYTDEYTPERGRPRGRSGDRGCRAGDVLPGHQRRRWPPFRRRWRRVLDRPVLRQPDEPWPTGLAPAQRT